MRTTISRMTLAIAALCAVTALVGVHSIAATPLPMPRDSNVYSPNSNMKGHSYAEWQAYWWIWALGLPVANHPFDPAADFDVTEGQTGDVWFLAAPFGTNTRTCTIPKDKNLFVTLINGEWSDLEGFPTEADQRAQATASTDQVVVDSLFFEIDGVPVSNLGDYRHQTAQFTFTAPTPWIFGATGGTGHSVDDGYYVMLKKLSPGIHTIHYGGTIDFGGGNTASMDMTYNLTQE